MKTNYLSFDLEISKDLPGDFNRWKQYRPLGISCAAILFSGYEPQLWYSQDQDGTVQAKMTQQDLWKLVKVLIEAVKNGWTIVSWNGLGFDFDVLAEESEEWELCRDLAINHIDMMFHFFCLQGYPLGLDKAASGLGLHGKLAGVSGEDAPILWAQGDYQKVLDYIAQDVRTTLDVAKKVDQLGYISWVSRRGINQQVRFPSGWLKVSAAMQLGKPDNSWMSDPLKRDEFYKWTIRNSY